MLTKKVKRFIDENSFCCEYLFKNYELFLSLLYAAGGRVSAILWWDHIKKSEQNDSIGGGGYEDPDNQEYMYAENQYYKEGFDSKTLDEIIEYISEIRQSGINYGSEYFSHELVPSFYLSNDTLISIHSSGEDLTVFEKGFPVSLNDKVSRVIKAIRKKCKLNNTRIECVHDYCSWSEKYYLSNNSAVMFPYRMYYNENEKLYTKLKDEDEKLIFDCIFTRNSNGFIREKHILNILSNNNLPEWCFPYILRLSSEYVVQIVEAIYEEMKNKNNSSFTEFCIRNRIMSKRSYTRMVSYWNEYYRADAWKFKDYIGKKLYSELFLPNRDFEKL